MSARSSKTENWGWAVTQRRCLNSPTFFVQAPTSDTELAYRHYWIYLCHSFTRAFVYSQMKPSSGESCILLENGSTQTLVVRASQCLFPAVCEFRIVREECYARGCDLCVQTLLLGVVVPRNDHNYSLYELKLWTFESPCKHFAKWAVTRRTLKNCRTVKLRGGRWALAQDNMVFAYHIHL